MRRSDDRNERKVHAMQGATSMRSALATRIGGDGSVPRTLARVMRHTAVIAGCTLERGNEQPDPQTKG